MENPNEWIAEKVAILEYDFGLSRVQAEQEARKRYQEYLKARK